MADNSSVAVAHVAPSIGTVVRQAVRSGLTLAFLALFGDAFMSVAMDAVCIAMGAVAPWQWGWAVAATALGFAALGRTEAAVHTWLSLGTSSRAASRIGMVDVTIAQTVGMGLLTGMLARWRCVLSLGGAFRATVATSIAFTLGLATNTSVAIVCLGARVWWL